MNDAIDTTFKLADFIVRSRWDDIPAGIRHEAKRALLNWAACALGGCREETVERLLAALREFAGPPQATLLGRGERVDALHAALVNAVSSNILDFDDTHIATVIHPTVPVASALLAAAERRPTRGARFLHALVLGVEAECRIGNAIAPGHFDHGWQSTATCGVFGAAVAAGRLYDLDRRQMAWAIGIAATQSSGLLAMIGSMSKSFSIGNAARSGLAAAALAASNFTSSECALEAPRGFLSVLGKNADLDQITGGLGASWELAANSYKAFPCGIVIHPVLDACLQLRAESGIAPEQIRNIVLTVHPLVLALTGNAAPRTGLEAKLSVHHSAAVALLFGAAGIREYSDELARAPDVADMRARVEVKVDPALPKVAASVLLQMMDGTRVSKTVAHAVGTVERPLGDDDLADKFRDLAQGVLLPDRIEHAIDLIWTIDRSDDVAELARALIPAE